MGLKSLLGGVVAATFVIGAGACYGTVDQGSEPEVVGDRAEIVAQKRDWLRTYDENCDVCFKAFELCEKGARDEAETDACQTALDACVRGGLVKPEEPGDGDDGDDGDDDVNDDAGVDGDDGDDVDGDDNDGEEDAGVDGDDNDDGDDVDGDDGDDADEDADEATEEAEDDGSDGDADGEPGDQVKGELIDNVRACLDSGESCLQADGADADECLTALKECVKEALEDAFENVCTTQRRECREEDGDGEELESVDDLCEGGIEDVID